jgi:hypothetical protein
MQYPREVLDEWDALHASRVRKDWGLLLAEKSTDAILDDVFRPGTDEFKRLGNSLFTQWHITLQWIENFPTLQECRERKRLDDYSWEKGLPLLFRFSRPSDLPESTAALEAMRDNSRTQSIKPDQQSTNERQTIFERNYAQPGVACQQNFGSKRSLISIYDHANRIGAAQNEEWEQEDGSVPPPISKDFIFIIGDGDPSYHWLVEYQCREGLH